MTVIRKSEFTRMNFRMLVDAFLGTKERTTKEQYIKDYNRFLDFLKMNKYVYTAENWRGGLWYLLLEKNGQEAGFLVADYVNHLVRQKIKNRTVNRMVNPLKSLSSNCQKNNVIYWVLKPDALPVSDEDIKLKGPSVEDLQDIFNVAGAIKSRMSRTRNLLILRFIFDHALRPYSIINIMNKDVDMDNRTFQYLRKSRGTELKTKSMTDTLHSCLLEWQAERAKLFHRPGRRQLSHDKPPLLIKDNLEPVDLCYISYHLAALAKKAGQGKLSANRIRHTAISNAADIATKNGICDLKLKKWSDHKSWSAFFKYLDTSESELNTITKGVSSLIT
jgi:integrase